jgi:hypothetical protein
MKRILFIAYLLLIPCWICAQEIESETTNSSQYAEAHIITSFVKSFDKGLSISLEEEIRSYPACRSHTTIGLAYTPIKYLSLSAAYVLKLYGDKGWNDPNDFLRHRVNIDATGQVSLGQWKLSLRERLMLDAQAGELNLQEKNRIDYTLRSRLQAQYSIPNQPLSIVGKMEIFNTLNAKYFGQYINELRPEIGLQWKVDKKNSLTLAYRYNYVYSRNFDILDSGNISLEHEYKHKHVILLTYKFGW